MKLYSFADEVLDLFERVSYDAQTWKIGDIGSPSIRRFLVNYKVLLRDYFQPACFLELNAAEFEKAQTLHYPLFQ